MNMHPDQIRYRDELVALSGFEPDVVGAWIVAATGPGVRVPGHGYLTPGRMFADVPTAARAAMAALERHQLAALNVTGPLRQMIAVGDHPAFPGTTPRILQAWMSTGRTLAPQSADA